MAYNSALVHLVSTGGPYWTNFFGRARKLLVFRAPWMIDSDSVWEALTLLPVCWNALRTLPDKTRATSAKSLATLCVLVAAWPLLLLCYRSCQTAHSGTKCQRRNNIKGISHVSLHSRSYGELHTTIKKPHRLLAHPYKGKHVLSGLANLTQPKLLTQDVG